MNDSVEYQKNRSEHDKAYKEHLETKKNSESQWAKYWSWDRKKARKKETISDPDEDKKINLIIKADVNGSLEVLLDVIDNYPNEKEVNKELITCGHN